MSKDTSDYKVDLVFESDPVTVSRKARDIIEADENWDIQNYLEGHFIQAKRKVCATNWSITLSIRIISQAGVQKVTLLAETYGKGRLVTSGLKKRVDEEIADLLRAALPTKS